MTTQMNISFSAEALVKMLKDVIRVVPNSTNKPALKHVLIVADKDDFKVDFYASSEEQSIRRTVFQMPTDSEVTIHESGSCLVPAKDLLEIAKRATGTIDFSVTVEEVPTVENKFREDIKVKLKFGKTNLTLVSLPVEQFAIYKPDVVETKTVKISAPALRALIKQTAYAVSKNESRPVLTGINLKVIVEGDNAMIQATSCDGMRLSQLRVIAQASESCETTIPAHSLSDLEALIPGFDDDEEVELRFTPNALIASWDDDGFQLVARALSDVYPDVARIIPTSLASKVKVNRLAFLETCERVSVMRDDESSGMSLVRLEFGEGKIVASSVNKKGSAKDEFEILDGESCAPVIAFNVRYLIDLLKSMSSENVRIGINAANLPAVVVPEGTASGLALISPILNREATSTPKEEDAQKSA